MSGKDLLKKNHVEMCWDGRGKTPFSKETTEIVFSEQHNAVKAKALDAEIEKLWSEKAAANPRIFNGLKFRLDTQEVDGESLKLMVGLTDYKSYLGTAFAPDDVLQAVMAEHSQSSFHPFMSHALGVESLLLTSDQKFAFIKRSYDVSEYQGYLCGPGGHAEPKNVVENSELLTHSEITETLSQDAKKTPLLNEMFDSALDEVAEEVGIPHRALSNLGVIGIARNTAARGKPDLLFLITTTLTMAEIQAIYDKGDMSEKYESTEIVFVPADDKEMLLNLLEEGNITPPSAAALICFLESSLLKAETQRTG